MFKDILKEVVDNADGAVASVLMGFDGITVDSYVAEAADSNIETVGMEYSVVLGQVRQAAEMLEIGHTSEVAVLAENMTTVMRLLNDEYFVAVTMLPSGNAGKARFLLRTKAETLLNSLT